MLAINVVMFAVELTAGVISGSTALLSDSLDNLGDALTYPNYEALLPMSPIRNK